MCVSISISVFVECISACISMCYLFSSLSLYPFMLFMVGLSVGCSNLRISAAVNDFAQLKLDTTLFEASNRTRSHTHTNTHTHNHTHTHSYTHAHTIFLSTNHTHTHTPRDREARQLSQQKSLTHSRRRDLSPYYFSVFGLIIFFS